MKRLRAMIGTIILAATLPASASTGKREALKSTIFSGTFGPALMVAADHEGMRLSGFYNDGKCRFAFAGKLEPKLLYMWPDYGEAYEIEGWNPATPELRFSVMIYSLARNGYQALISLRTGSGDTHTTMKCPWRITLDRSVWMSSTFLGVRVVRASHPRIYEFKKDGKSLALQTRDAGRLAKNTGVWMNTIYSDPSTHKGLVPIAWYPGDGRPRGGYIRETDLYPLPTEKP